MEVVGTSQGLNNPDTLAVAETDSAMLLHAERAVVSKLRLTTIVRAVRSTTTRDEPVDEELTHDQVVIERVAIGRQVDAAPPIRHEGDTTVFPVVEEIIVIERRLILKEEVRVRQIRTTSRHIETVPLRSQEAAVTRTRIDAAATTPGAMTDSHPFPHTPIGRTNMTEETIVAVYDTPAHAALAVEDLKMAGIDGAAISTHAENAGMTNAGTTDGRTGPVREEGFWASLFGGEPGYDSTVYERSMTSGGTVVTVRVPEAMAAKASAILESHSPIDIDERATGYGVAAVSAPHAPPATGAANTGDTIQLAEERLSVGKRLINRGGTRIRRFVVETPVEESVTLREEHVSLERRPVTDGRPVTNADFTDKTIEMAETAEEVVVSKQAFVLEEIALRKTATDRVETVRDTVRREDVEIVQIPAEKTAQTSTTPVMPAATQSAARK